MSRCVSGGSARRASPSPRPAAPSRGFFGGASNPTKPSQSAPPPAQKHGKSVWHAFSWWHWPVRPSSLFVVVVCFLLTILVLCFAAPPPPAQSHGGGGMLSGLGGMVAQGMLCYSCLELSVMPFMFYSQLPDAS